MILGGVLFQIDQNVPIRRGRCIGERLLNKLDSTTVHLFDQCSILRHISRILEHHYVLSVQTDGATLLFLGNRFFTRYMTEVLLLCTAGQTGCLPWLAVVCMYHRRRSCRIAYGRHHVIVCVQSCVCSEGEHTLHISCCFGGRRQISLRLLY